LSICFITTFYFMFWVPLGFLPKSRRDLGKRADSRRFRVQRRSGSFIRVAATVEDADGLVSSMALGGVVVGSVSFAAGFFGPIVFAPQANQGPLLGILIHRPLGAIVGASAEQWYG
jgi:hypothetical protein